jgi:signal peptidase I
MARAFRITIGIVGFLAFALVWHYFAPTQIGGKAGYVTIRGVSMEPLMHEGDLVVLDRIVGRDGERYIARGDNTQGPDREQPPQSAELILGGVEDGDLTGRGVTDVRIGEPGNDEFTWWL